MVDGDFLKVGGLRESALQHLETLSAPADGGVALLFLSHSHLLVRLVFVTLITFCLGYSLSVLLLLSVALASFIRCSGILCHFCHSDMHTACLVTVSCQIHSTVFAAAADTLAAAAATASVTRATSSRR